MDNGSPLVVRAAESNVQEVPEYNPLQSLATKFLIQINFYIEQDPTRARLEPDFYLTQRKFKLDVIRRAMGISNASLEDDREVQNLLKILGFEQTPHYTSLITHLICLLRGITNYSRETSSLNQLLINAFETALTSDSISEAERDYLGILQDCLLKIWGEKPLYVGFIAQEA